MRAQTHAQVSTRHTNAHTTTHTHTHPHAPTTPPPSRPPTSCRSTSESSFLLRACTLRISRRPFWSGTSTDTCRSNRPGRSSAGSRMSARLVAAMTMMPVLPSKPSISVSSWLSVCSRSSLPPPMPVPRERPTASISSTNTWGVVGEGGIALERASARFEAVGGDRGPGHQQAQQEGARATLGPGLRALLRGTHARGTKRTGPSKPQARRRPPGRARSPWPS
jgi:hypothetical protein